MKRLLLTSAATVAAFVSSHAAPAQFDFPIYTNKPPGKQLAGQHAAASNPAMKPADAQKMFVVPKGFEVRLFASEPMVVNPVAMTWDDRGRLWVVELYEYPKGTMPGEKGRDRIKILEDVDGDGVADKATVFADGMTLATGLLLGNGGVYVGEAPNLWFMQDTDGDGKADKKTAVLTGFGLEDRHELLNGFTWGPDGQLYMTHGVFTRTKATDPNSPNAEPVVLTAGVARFDTRKKHFEVFAEGTSNPWGVDFDAKGNAFVSACVIDHLFHLAPGGIYTRQGGQAPYLYGYGDLKSIVDHKHHMAAYAGIDIYQGNQWPGEWNGAALHGNIHQNAINIDRLTTKGSSFLASKWNDSGDFLTTKDGWFMPVSIQTGPDGAVWLMDWYDKYPCYQNANADPEGVDREHGRIWRVVWTGDKPGSPVPSRPAKDMDLAKLSSSELVKLLEHPNNWQRRSAQRLLNERRDDKIQGQLQSLFNTGKNLDQRLAAFWTLFSSGYLADDLLAKAVDDKEPAVRVWAARVIGDHRVSSEERMKWLETLARDDDPTVRSAVASASRQFVSGQLTVNAPLPTGVERYDTGAILAALVESGKAGDDATVGFLTWMAAEPIVVAEPERTLQWFAENGQINMPFAGTLVAKTLRRLCDLRDGSKLDLALDFLSSLTDADSPLAVRALDGLIDGQRGKAISPTRSTEPVLKKLLASANKDVVSRAQQLGSLWGDANALKASLVRINDTTASEADRIAAVKTAARVKSDDARRALMGVLAVSGSDSLKVEAVRALQQVGEDDTGRQLLEKWNSFTPAVRAAVAELTTSRGNWKWPLYSAVEKGDVKRGDLPPTVIRTLATSGSNEERNKAEQIFGKVRATSAEKLKLIDAKRKVVASGPIDLVKGREVAARSCLICHKMYGEGAEIGPDLTGVGRSSLDALLHNVIHPNEIIGAGYENVEIETKDDRFFSGRMVENNATIVKLIQAGPAESVVAKSDIKSLKVSENSVMPEGLEAMPDDDFRNMIWFILAHPKDGKPLDDQRRQELMGGSGGRASVPLPARDGESIALWAPEWRVDAPDFEGSPAKLPEFAGRNNVLMTHPYDSEKPAAIVRALMLPRDVRATLRFSVAAHEKGDWELRIKSDGELLHKQTVKHDGPRWQEVALDVSSLAGRRVVLRLENAANNWAYEFGYWSNLRIDTSEVAAK